MVRHIMAKSRNNPVAKNAHKFNRSAVMVDRKKQLKKTGYEKGRRYCVDEDFYDSAGGKDERF